MKRIISQTGMALIEVLIAWAVLSTVLLSITVFQMESVRAVGRAYLRSVALVQVTSMLERLRANKTPASRLRELRRWNEENQHLLPHAEGSYRCDRVQFCEVKLVWQERVKRRLMLKSVL